MAELYLIAHKVRGEAAFDVAVRMECPECHHGYNEEDSPCSECDNMGYWWIIPTSGHRAHPYWSANLDHMMDSGSWPGEMPPDLPDHYPTRAEPTQPKRSLLAELGLAKRGHPAMTGKLTRRI